MKRKGKEAAQLNVLVGYLKDLGLLDSRNSYPNSDFTIAAIRALEYKDVWGEHVRNQWYDIRLDDNSLLYFYRDNTSVSFSYLGCPYECEPYSIYRSKQELHDFEDYFVQELYENELTSSQIKNNPCYFRFDYDEGSYRPGEHPVAHLHCGLMENVRIGFKIKLDIMAFVAFILRQVYVQHWNLVLNNQDDYRELFFCKSNLCNIEDSFYKQWDKDQDFYMI